MPPVNRRPPPTPCSRVDGYRYRAGCGHPGRPGSERRTCPRCSEAGHPAASSGARFIGRARYGARRGPPPPPPARRQCAMHRGAVGVLLACALCAVAAAQAGTHARRPAQGRVPGIQARRAAAAADDGGDDGQGARQRVPKDIIRTPRMCPPYHKRDRGGACRRMLG
ncbi:uncharacterized protein LOC134534999 [Bacillus rossius redtenbacheri]|uniref:uncharacterized protein LOC134534999 n=1 Tax=Bacillus rossius redtenbacheri TaxID=93214 RepID=UPI002FDDD3B2